MNHMTGEIEQKILKIMLMSLQESFRIQTNMKLDVLQVKEEVVKFTPDLTGGMISFVGDEYKGKMRMVFTKTFLTMLCKAMLDEVGALNSADQTSAALEMLNIVYANARTKINGLGLKFNLAIPSELIRNQLNEIETWNRSVKIDCKTSIGKFTTEISILRTDAG